MIPSELKSDSFRNYPPVARDVVAARLDLFRRLPLPFLALLLREVIVYDWKFPAERKDLDRQLAYLSALNSGSLESLLGAFARLQISPALERADWVQEPGLFSEQLTAHLWATHQIEGFRTSAVAFMEKVNSAAPEKSDPIPRVGVVAIGQGVPEYSQPMFRKLKPHGVHFTNVSAKGGFPVLVDAVSKRAARIPVPFGHWYIDGGVSASTGTDERLTCLSYETLRPLRGAMQARIQKAFRSGMGSEALRTQLAQLKPEELGLDGVGNRAVLNRFEISLFSEGSGTQIFSTTFAQWAAREALRRAQPYTLLLRFAPRQKERPMVELLTEVSQKPILDPEGSLRDADMGAYYTYLNLQRLPAATPPSFLVWFEDHNQAVAIGPNLAPGTTSNSPIELAELIRRVG